MERTVRSPAGRVLLRCTPMLAAHFHSRFLDRVACCRGGLSRVWRWRSPDWRTRTAHARSESARAGFSIAGGGQCCPCRGERVRRICCAAYLFVLPFAARSGGHVADVKGGASASFRHRRTYCYKQDTREGISDVERRGRKAACTRRGVSHGAVQAPFFLRSDTAASVLRPVLASSTYRQLNPFG